MKIEKTTGFRLRVVLGDGVINEGKHKGTKFYISNDSIGVIIEIENAQEERDYYILKYKEIVDKVLDMWGKEKGK